MKSAGASTIYRDKRQWIHVTALHLSPFSYFRSVTAGHPQNNQSSKPYPLPRHQQPRPKERKDQNPKEHQHQQHQQQQTTDQQQPSSAITRPTAPITKQQAPGHNTQHHKPDSQQGAPPTYHSHQPSSYYQTTTILSQHQHQHPNTNGDPQSANTINTEREPPAAPAPRPTACQPGATNVDLSSSTYHQPSPQPPVITNQQLPIPMTNNTTSILSTHDHGFDYAHHKHTHHLPPNLSQLASFILPAYAPHYSPHRATL
jgi:hypothetical protein